MKLSVVATALLICFSFAANAEEKMKMNFPNEDLPKVLEYYSKTTGQKFVVDANVRGKISLLNPTDITREEAFNQLSAALALNGFAFTKQGDTYVVRSARSVQRDNTEVTTELPKESPVRMVTWVINIKNVSANDLHRELRMLISSYGEMSVIEKTNQIVITDWSTNLQRVSEILKKTDIKPDAAATKIANEAKKERMERMARAPKEPKEMKGMNPPHMNPPPPQMEEPKERN